MTSRTALSRTDRRGVALLAVLLVLMALFVLCAPYLSTIGGAEKSSVRMTERASVRVALDAASRRARGRLAGSHQAIDRTPYYDDLAELGIDNLFPPGFDDANDPKGVMWDVEAEDQAGRIDLNSATPFVLGNLLGGVAFLSQPLEKDANELTMTSFDGFGPEGFVHLRRELIGYAELEGNALKKLVRGIAAVEEDEEGHRDPCGPQPASVHPRGSLVVDQRLLALPTWRTLGPEGGFRTLSTIEELLDAEQFVLAERLPAADVATLHRVGSVHGHVRGGPRWTRAVRVNAAIVAGEESCYLDVDEPRLFNPGTTVRITDGRTTEYGLVWRVANGRVELLEPLVNDYAEYTAELSALVRRPVNVNTASPEVLKALFLNLQLRGTTERISTSDADRLVEDVVALRPFDGHADFLQRLVLPAAGLDVPNDDPLSAARVGGAGDEEDAGYLDDTDAIALYKNALNANDYELEYSTMPFCFTSRDVYAFDVRAAVNAPSGVMRVAGARSEVHLVVPQVELMTVLARQKDFDDAQLLARNGPGWVTGPVPTRRYDSVSRSPTEARAHLGPHDRMFEGANQQQRGTNTPFYRSSTTGGTAQGWVDPPPASLALPSREEDLAWAQLEPARADEEDDAGGVGWTRAGKLMHFDNEVRSLEGHYLPDEAYSFAPDDPMLDWIDDDGFTRPIYCEAWIKPRSLASGETYFDLAGSIADTDRVSLLIDDGDLVLRVLDGAGDHPDTVFEEVAEVRYPLSGTGPGLPADVWSHVAFDVRGNRPDQMTLLVDGRWSNETPGLTRLSAGLGPSDSAIAVESTEGFPDRCVLRIGSELIEATRSGSGAFVAVHQTTGADCGFGGRAARERWSVVGDAPANDGVVQKDRTYAAGTPVALYGYSLAIPDDHWVPVQTATLGSEIGPFSVLYATGIVRDGEPRFDAQAEPITVQIGTPPVPVTLGWGMRFDTDAEGLVLESADAGRTTADAMRTFSPDGGYAVLVGPGRAGTVNETSDGNPFGYLEVVHYSGWSDNQLLIDRRGDVVAGELGVTAEDDASFGGKRSWIVSWNASLFQSDPNDVIANRLLVYPISVPAPGADMAAGIGFLPATQGDSQFAQFTRLGAEADQTEWVRYDSIVGGHLVRTHPDALRRSRFAARGGNVEIEDDPQPPSGPGPGQQGPPGTGGGKQPMLSLAPVTNPAPSPVQQASPGIWGFEWGAAEDTDLLVTRAVASYFQFRGVLGTHSHTHPAGTQVLPVFQMSERGETGGWPGRFDPIMLLESSVGGGGTAPAWPATVHRAIRPPAPLVLYGYAVGAGPLESTEAQTDWIADAPDIQFGETPASVPDLYDRTVTYVALEAAPSFPVGTSGGNVLEQRSLGRMAMFPSGERPRVVAEARLGGAVVGQGVVPSGLVDEVAWGWSRVGGTDGTAGAQFQLAVDASESDASLTVASRAYRVAGGEVAIGNRDVLNDTPSDAGVLRVGDELMVFNGRNVGSGDVTIAPGGRGVLGTIAQPHATGESVTFLGFLRVTTLTSSLGAQDGELAVADVDGFPPEGTVLVGDELLHYTRVRGNTLSMPRSSTAPGAKDGKGVGLFRGRYGTLATDHAAGESVILYPFRFWDRWADEADAPELSYHQVTVDQPGAFWRTAFFDVEESGLGGSRLKALARTDQDVPWDAAPFETRGLKRLELGMPEGEGNALGVRADRLDLRLYVEYLPGAYDALDGLSHAWKTVPRLRLVGAEYVAPNVVLRRVER